MNSPSKHSRKPSASLQEGLHWAAWASSIGMQMAVPPGLGFLADRHFGTSPKWTIAGVCLGFVLAMLVLFRLAKGDVGRRHRPNSHRGDPPSTQASSLPDDRSPNPRTTTDDHPIE